MVVAILLVGVPVRLHRRAIIGRRHHSGQALLEGFIHPSERRVPRTGAALLSGAGSLAAHG